jgi:hypothetical protein
MNFNYQTYFMYFATIASACWFALGVMSGVTEAFIVSGAFAFLSFLYWDNS